MLRRVERREIDVIVGTQMIAKGLDLPLVTAVGVIHADTTLHLPDFRAGERTFQLLTQVAGRPVAALLAAASSSKASPRIITRFKPPRAIDYATFYAEEIDFSAHAPLSPVYPSRSLPLSDADEAKCAAEADLMARVLAAHAHARDVPADLLGPTPAFASRVRGRYQWQIILRAVDLDPLLDGLPARFGWTVDVDPQSLL
jgi:primosomal protein N' (replication factor Y)